MNQARTAGESSRPSSRGSPLRLGASTLSFVFSLCLPYVASSPLPASADSEVTATSSLQSLRRTMSDPVSILRSLSSLARSPDPGGSQYDSLDPPIGSPGTSDVSGDILRPILAIARPDLQGMYHVPPNFIVLHQRFIPGFIVLSYAIAFVGSLCTLELLIRRTTNTGWRNRVLLAAAGCTFGSVSTFAMHFIFNNSLSLHHPLHPEKYPSLHLAYSPGYTVLSLVASCLAMTGAFFVMGTRLQDWWFLPSVRRRAAAEKESPDAESKSPKSSIFSKYTDKGYSKRRSYSVETILQQAGQVAKWSLVHPTPTSLSDDSNRWKKWRRESKENKFKENRRSWAGYTEGESTEEFAKGDATRLDELPTRNRTEPTLELIESRPSEDVQVVEHHQPADNSYFTPGYDFASPASHEPDTSFGELSPMSPRRLLSPGDGQTTPLDIDTFVSPGPSSPPISPTSARPGYRPTFTLKRISSVPEEDMVDNPPPSSHRLRPPVPARASSSPIGPRTTSLPNQPAKFKDTSTTRSKQSYTKLETFFGLDVLTRVELIKLCITGIIAGCGVAAMHYIGQLSIIGIPYIAYKVPYVVGSVIIACGAVTVALYILFIMLRPKLKHTWWAKLAVAAILAIAVCGMHFCGMMGTVYAWRLHDTISTVNLLTGTNRAITAIVACLAFAACLASVVFFVLQSLKLRRERARRRRVVVAAVMMDDDDRILVDTTDGMLPMCDIANLTGGGRRDNTSSKRSHKSGETTSMESSVLGMDLTTGHEAFVNALKMSWAWQQSPADKEKEQLTRPNPVLSLTSATATSSPVGEVRRGSVVTTSSSALTGFPKAVSLSAAKFLDKFASSSNQLSLLINGHATSLSRLGVLYDQILTTGWVKLNNSNDTVSKGQLIFLVRRVTSTMEQSALTTRQYIFADPQAVASTLEKTLSVPRDHAMPLLDDIRRFCDSTIRAVPQAGRVYAGVAIVQATPFDGLRVLLEQGNRAQLPMREICTIDPIASPAVASTVGSERHLIDLDTALSGTLEQLGEAITWLEGMSLMAIMSRNMALSSDPPSSPSDHLGGVRVTKLLQALERAIVPMLDGMLSPEDMAHILPRLYLHPVLVPLTPGGPTSSSNTSYIPPYVVVFYANYDIAINTFSDKWLPFTLFRAQNACVMAQSIALAENTYGQARATPPILATSIPTSAIGSTWVPGDIGADEGILARRPSKVQFELNPATISPHTYHSPLPTPPAPIPEDESGSMIKDYSFPPRRASETSPPHRPPPLASTKERSPKSATTDLPSPSSSASPTSPTSPTSANPLIQSGLPRKSSLASKSRFEEREQGVLGIGDWDPEWLLTLLRTKLRADA